MEIPESCEFGRLVAGLFVIAMADEELDFRCNQVLMRQYLNFFEEYVLLELNDEIDGIQAKSKEKKNEHEKQKLHGCNITMYTQLITLVKSSPERMVHACPSSARRPGVCHLRQIHGPHENLTFFVACMSMVDVGRLVNAFWVLLFWSTCVSLSAHITNKKINSMRNKNT